MRDLLLQTGAVFAAGLVLGHISWLVSDDESSWPIFVTAAASTYAAWWFLS